MVMRTPLYWVRDERFDDQFPDTARALSEPNGLLAAGGDLSVDRILEAYKQGIFPWFSDGQPILWWAPDPRSIMRPDEMKISRSLRKTLKREPFVVTFDKAFGKVIRGCAAPRGDLAGTWITQSMINAYEALHRHGYAHSIECWLAEDLVGGLYGVALGQVFFGESMFSRVTDSSKVAMVHLLARLNEWGYQLIDCQVHNPHLVSLGAKTISRDVFGGLLAMHCATEASELAWLKRPVQ
ncbi:MAG: leucyl/phenylalanyl-tRNA--protein transferase [Proteobacteria bacterium]|nr:leucyl/phenylalanyl-tRNA--protein transferase [Pseudomonadota bacterium]